MLKPGFRAENRNPDLSNTKRKYWQLYHVVHRMWGL